MHFYPKMLCFPDAGVYTGLSAQDTVGNLPGGSIQTNQNNSTSAIPPDSLAGEILEEGAGPTRCPPRNNSQLPGTQPSCQSVQVCEPCG